jgi:hypothetical protein
MTGMAEPLPKVPLKIEPEMVDPLRNTSGWPAQPAQSSFSEDIAV